MSALPLGKLPPELLDGLLKRYVTPDPRVILGPRVGEDAAVIDFGDRYLVAKTDPITFATDQIGRYAVNVNANDIACCGAVPRWYLATLLLPEGRTSDLAVDMIFDQISSACRRLGVAWCGGHTEITYGIDRPLVIGQMLGEVAPDDLVTTGGARVGDSLILTKGIALEGTCILAREREDELFLTVLSEAEIERCRLFLLTPGISVVEDAQLALDVGGVTALHDPTEGGLATGLWELCQAADIGMVIQEDKIPILPECRAVCDYYSLDPLGLIASGALLIAADPDRAASIVDRLDSGGVDAGIIGTLVDRREGCRIFSPDGQWRPLPWFSTDELTRLFESG